MRIKLELSILLIKVFNLMTLHDLVITSDIILADNCIKKGMRVLKPNGEELNSINIGNSLALRDLSSDLRASNPFLQGSGKVFSKQDRIRFLDNFEKIVRLLKKRSNVLIKYS